MRFKIFACALVLAADACGSSNSTLPPKNYEIGRKPEFFSTSYLFRSGDQNSITAVDRKGHTLQRFNLEPFEHVRSLSLPLDYDKQGVLAAANGAYFITISESDFAILKDDGSFLKNPKVGLSGKIGSAAFDPVHHFLVITDEFKSMGLLAMAPNGDIVGSWMAGSLFPGEKSIIAGTMLDDGRLILSVGETTIAVVDVPATIAAQAWQFTSFEVPDAKTMTWMASVPNQADSVMVVDQNATTSTSRLLSLNVASGAVVDIRDTTKRTVFGQFRDYTPHFISQNSDDALAGQAIVNYLGDDGKFLDRKVPSSGKQILQTWLDPKTTMLTVAFDPNAGFSPTYDDPYYHSAQDIYRVRLSDNLTEITQIREVSNMAITPSYIFLLYPSALGKARRLTYGKTPDEQNLEGYNFDLFSKGYRKGAKKNNDD